jgi:hypothetical protein
LPLQEIIDKCHKLDVKDKEFQKWNKPAKYLAISAIILGLIALIYSPEGKNVSYPWQSYVGAIYFVIAIPIAFILSKMARKYKISGFETNAVNTYRAYGLVARYQKDSLQSQLEKAQDCMYSVLSNLQKWSGEVAEEKPAFKFLTEPIENFINNLDNRVIPAIGNETSDDIALMLDTLSKITIVFIGEEFNEIKSVNEWIENKHKDVSEGKKSAAETIKQHHHVVTLLISFGIIVAGGILAYSTRFIKSDISVDTQILVWVGISVPFVIWGIIARQRR